MGRAWSDCIGGGVDSGVVDDEEGMGGGEDRLWPVVIGLAEPLI